MNYRRIAFIATLFVLAACGQPEPPAAPAASAPAASAPAVEATVDLAEKAREIARLKANDSQECRNCHNTDMMLLGVQTAKAQEFHQAAKSKSPPPVHRRSDRRGSGTGSR